MKNIEEIRQIFKNDRFATLNGAVIDEVCENFAKCSLVVTDNHRNAVGGVMFMLADFAFAVAANHDVMNTVSISSNIAFVGVCKGTKLIATAKCLKAGKSTCYYNISVCDELENLVCEVNITGFKKS